MGLNPISEPTGVYPESEFERSLAPLIERALHGCRAVVVPKFGLDIAVFLEDVGPPQPLFVEVKSYGGKRQGGVGFGNGRGEGPQVDLLVGDASALFDSYTRWAFVDATQPVGTDRYAFLTCSDARGRSDGGGRERKAEQLQVGGASNRTSLDGGPSPTLPKILRFSSR